MDAIENASVRVRVESGVERAVRVQPGNAVAGHAQDARKIAADQNLAVRLDDDDRTAPLAFGSKPSSADCPRTVAAPPASSTATENRESAAFLVALDVALANEVNAET